jgi:hypothetical protein
MGKPRTTKMDFSQHPDKEKGFRFACLNKTVDERLKRFEATYDRAKGALHFCARITNMPDIDTKGREAYLRAALGEFVSMKEMIRRDEDSTTGAPRIDDSSNPLLRIMKELRNLQFHLISSPMKTEQLLVTGSEGEHEMPVWFIENLSIGDFEDSRNRHLYKSTVLQRMIDWFNKHQRPWGVPWLLQHAVNAYAEEIVSWWESPSCSIPGT